MPMNVDTLAQIINSCADKEVEAWQGLKAV
jgi:hypothetical protein